MGAPGDGGFVGEDADDFGATLDLAVEALDGIGAVQLGVNRPGFAGGSNS
jgi:hypothetical protein